MQLESGLSDGCALMIDILSDLDREHQGVMQGSVHILRTVLEWRVAPESPWRKPHLGGLDRQLVLLCDHGYSSSLATATLVELGLDATDVIGRPAWRHLAS
jgi:rhodanese-related sulfurtransferase